MYYIECVHEKPTKFKVPRTSQNIKECLYILLYICKKWGRGTILDIETVVLLSLCYGYTYNTFKKELYQDI